MSDAKHTVGPWTHTPMQDTVWANDGDIKIASIADLPWVESPTGKKHSDFETEQANARLIAAAPDLLAALEHVLSFVHDGNAYNFGKAALAKAKGEV